MSFLEVNAVEITVNWLFFAKAVFYLFFFAFFAAGELPVSSLVLFLLSQGRENSLELTLAVDPDEDTDADSESLSQLLLEAEDEDNCNTI